MDLEVVLNELSLKKQADDVQTAQELMSGFITTLREVESAKNVKITLIYQRDLLSNETNNLAPNYPLRSYIYDRSVDEKERRLLIALMTKGPYIDETNLDEFLYQGKIAIGLGYAYQHNDLAISLKTDACWDTPSLQLEYNQVTDDGEVFSEQVDVTHASCQEHVLFHKNWLQAFVRESLQLAVFDGTELWKRKEELFPGLLFCESVKHQLQGVLHGQLLLGSIYNRLSELEQFCADWSQGSFDPQKLPSKTTPESTATLKMFEAEHTFRCPDGQYRIFSWHVRLTPDAWRIYFYAEDVNRRLIIGHIGHKLPNMLYRT